MTLIYSMQISVDGCVEDERGAAFALIESPEQMALIC